MGIEICLIKTFFQISSFIIQVLEHDWIDEKVISEVTVKSSWQNLH